MINIILLISVTEWMTYHRSPAMLCGLPLCLRQWGDVQHHVHLDQSKVCLSLQHMCVEACRQGKASQIMQIPETEITQL